MLPFRRFWFGGWSHMQAPRPASPLDYALAAALVLIMAAVSIAGLLMMK
jgi:hypothetical protein